MNMFVVIAEQQHHLNGARALMAQKRKFITYLGSYYYVS